MKAIGKEKDTESLTALSAFSSDDQPSENKAPHQRAYWVEKTRKRLGERPDGSEYSFGQINGITGKWSVSKLKKRFHYCSKHADCSFAKAWWGIRKKEKNESKESNK